MPRTRTSRSRAIPPSLRRKRVWARNSVTMIPSAAGVATDLLANFQTAAGILAPPPGVTVGGILLDLSVVQTAARASSTDGVTFGIIVTSEATSTEVPVPGNEQHADWLWYQFLAAPGAASGANYSTASVLGGPIRIRSRRRMDELGMHLWLASNLTGTTTYDLRLVTSTLLIMP
jgi:hypothetical protein